MLAASPKIARASLPSIPAGRSSVIRPVSAPTGDPVGKLSQKLGQSPGGGRQAADDGRRRWPDQ